MRIDGDAVSLSRSEAEIAYGQWSTLVARVDELTARNEGLARLARDVYEDMCANYEPKNFPNDAWMRMREYSDRMRTLGA